MGEGPNAFVEGSSQGLALLEGQCCKTPGSICAGSSQLYRQELWHVWPTFINELFTPFGAQLQHACAVPFTVSSLWCPEGRSDVGAQAGTVVLVIGGGGREHALCYSLKHSPSCATVLCAPGNIGISQADDAECCPDVDVSSSEAVIQLCRQRGVGLVVVGPEAPLVAGLVDDLRAEGIPAFGPTQAAAALEGSKSFMKDICEKYGVPTAKVLYAAAAPLPRSCLHGHACP